MIPLKSFGQVQEKIFINVIIKIAEEVSLENNDKIYFCILLLLDRYV